MDRWDTLVEDLTRDMHDLLERDHVPEETVRNVAVRYISRAFVAAERDASIELRTTAQAAADLGFQNPGAFRQFVSDMEKTHPEVARCVWKNGNDYLITPEGIGELRALQPQA